MSQHKFLCKNCRKEITVASEAIGQRANCVLCGTAQTVPTREADAAYREALSRSLEGQAEERLRQVQAESVRKEKENRQKEVERAKQREEEERLRAEEQAKREEEGRHAEAARKENIRAAVDSFETQAKGQSGSDASKSFTVSAGRPAIPQRITSAPPWLLCVFLCGFGVVWTISFFSNSDIGDAALGGLVFGFIILTAMLIAVHYIWRINRLSVAAAVTGFLAVVENFRGKGQAGHALSLICAVLWTGSFLVSKLTNASPATHVQCPDCREFIRKEARVCGHCGCKLIPRQQ